MKTKRAEEFEKFEIEPSPEVWNRIEKNLPNGRKRKWFIFWFGSAIIVSGIVVMTLTGNHTETRNEAVLQQPAAGRSHELSREKNSITEETTPADQNYRKIPSTDNPVRSEPLSEPLPVAAIDKSKSGSMRQQEPKRRVNSAIPSTGHKPINTNSNSVQEATTFSTMPDQPSKFKENNRDRVNSEIALSLPKKYNLLSQKLVENEKIITRNNTDNSNCKVLTRWSVFAAGGIFYSSISESQSLEETGGKTIMGLTNPIGAAGFSYDVSSKFMISAGVRYAKLGHEQDASNKVILNGPPQDPNVTYSIITANGDVTGNGITFNNALFNTPDSVLFPVVNTASLNEETLKTVNFRLRREFTYIEIPVSITYRPFGSRISPHASLFVNTGFLNGYSVFVNDNRLAYEYESGLSDIYISAGIAAGAEFSLSRSIGIFMDGFYQQSLNSITSGTKKYKPFGFGGEAGIRYRFSKCIQR